MTRWQQNPSSVTVGLAITAGLFILLATAIAAQAQTFQVLHNFTGGRDGANPLDGVTIDRNGNLYGTASAGGNQVYGCDNFYGTTGCGSVFELERSGSGWILRPLYDFDGGNDFGNPSIGVVLGPDGALYGLSKGAANCTSYYVCGAVFRLAPPPTFCASFTCNWQETVLHQFTGQPDGSYPASRVIFDPAGNLYGVTVFGGLYNEGGAAYELSPGSGGWTENVLYSFNPNLGPGNVASERAAGPRPVRQSLRHRILRRDRRLLQRRLAVAALAIRLGLEQYLHLQRKQRLRVGWSDQRRLRKSLRL